MIIPRKDCWRNSQQDLLKDFERIHERFPDRNRGSGSAKNCHRILEGNYLKNPRKNCSNNTRWITPLRVLFKRFFRGFSQELLLGYIKNFTRNSTINSNRRFFQKCIRGFLQKFHWAFHQEQIRIILLEEFLTKDSPKVFSWNCHRDSTRNSSADSSEIPPGIFPVIFSRNSSEDF